MVSCRHLVISSLKDDRQIVALAVMDAITAASRTINFEVVARKGVRAGGIYGIATCDVIVVAGRNIAAVVAGHFSAGYVDLVLGGGLHTKHSSGH